MTKIIKIAVPTFAIVVIMALSFMPVYDMREKILTSFDNLFDNNFAADGHPGHAYWAEEIQNGGYILHFRHAEREKWIDVQMYDALESDLHNSGLDGTRYAEDEYFSKAVCLNSRGLIQAKAMSEILEYARVPVGKVVTSPSCRARQTAAIAFGGYDEMKRILVHKGPYSETEQNRVALLKDLYVQQAPNSNTNTIISAHNSVVHKGMFENHHSLSDLYLEEGGFYVISERNGKLFLEHEFHYFKDFSKQFFPR
jgi:phosphohistidine phosphatase SixA